MKKILLILFATAISFGGMTQVRDTLKTDTIKKEVIIKDHWSGNQSNSQKKVENSRNRGNFENRTDTTSVKILSKDVVKIVENDRGAKIEVGRNGRFGVVEDRDTTRIRIGRKQINVIDDWHGTRIRIERVEPWDPNQDEFYGQRERRFRGHWAGFEMGVNGFANKDYSAYGGNEFMELNMTKSTAVNLNFLQYDISLQKDRNTIGLVTGLGLEWNNYRFDRKVTIQDEDGMVQPVDLLEMQYGNIKKSKLTNLYLTCPLLLEFQIPVKYDARRIHLSAGVVGGLRLSSHTKIKYKTDGNTRKDKDHDDFNLKAFRYAAQVRMGYKSLNLFASYGLTELFENNKGPELTPYTIGITLVTF